MDKIDSRTDAFVGLRKIAVGAILTTIACVAGCGDPQPLDDPNPLAPAPQARSPSIPAIVRQSPSESSPETSAMGSTEIYSFDLPKEYPLAAASWKANLPLDFQDLAWAAKFEGVGSPLRTVTLNERQVLFGSLCEPHNCGNNRVGFVLTPDQRRVVGFVQVTDDRSGVVSLTSVGGPSREEQACLMKLDEDLEATTC